MAEEEKGFGDGVGLIILMIIIVAVGLGFFLVALLYKLLSTGHLCAPIADSGENTNPPPAASVPGEVMRTGARDNRPDAVERAYLQSLPEDEESHQPTEVAAIIIPIKMKVPKHGRTIITPRADVLNSAVVAVDARAYESDLESNASERSSAPPQRRVTPALIPQVPQVVARDHRAPDWYDDDNGDEDSLPMVRTVTSSADTSRVTSNSQPPTPAALDHRAPDWYND
jgi:hypothetical protein